jgi:DNA-binding beta-propeller fold protein YncE
MDLIGALSGAAGAAGEAGNPNAWDISKAYYDAGDDAGDVSTTRYTTFSGAGIPNPRGVYIRADGTKAYVINTFDDSVYEYDFNYPWAFNSLTLVQNFSVSAQESDPSDVFFKSDGTKMYVIGKIGDDVNEYSLSTAWDISTASYVQNFSVSTEETFPEALFFKPDGTKMYVIGTSGDDVNQYDLSSAWDISTASYVQNFSVSGQEANPSGIAFLGDGTKMYVIGTSGDDVNQYDLSSAWDISTASYVQNFSVSSQTSAPTGLFFIANGSMFFVNDDINSTTHQYFIGGFSVATEETVPTGIAFKSDGTKMYVTGTAGDDVNEYDLSTAWDITTASYLQNFSIAGQETNPSDLFFKSDGTKMYIVGVAGDDINEYDLSTPWDVSTASYLQNKALGGTPRGISFKDDGSKVYIADSTADNINEYDLSTAWDVSTATFLQALSVAAQVGNTHGIFFKPDGTKMYLSDDFGNAIFEYDLSTPWDVSTGSFTSKLGLVAKGPQGMYFRDNGEEFFVISNNVDRVLKYTISPD